MDILKLVPKEPDWNVPWDETKSIFEDMFSKLNETEQDPIWHAEGNVLIHTRMVCESLASMVTFRQLEEVKRQVVYIAALMHDFGKPITTCEEDGKIVAPKHARVGEEIARQLLWQKFDFCGMEERQKMRESICGLIRYHGIPIHGICDEDGIFKLRKVAAIGELTEYFSIELLCMLAEADVRGRICEDQSELLEYIELCRELAKENNFWGEYYPFPSDYTEFAYFSGRNVLPEYELYDDTWGEVILMSGLPGTGKDTWISKEYPDLPVISLDDIRKELSISPIEPQGPVIIEARERAKQLLRKKQSFVWNATNTTKLTREKQVDLFISYGAAVRIVYLETTMEEQFSRNAGRSTSVPENVILDLLKKLTPPQRWEGHCVEWHCI